MKRNYRMFCLGAVLAGGVLFSVAVAALPEPGPLARPTQKVEWLQNRTFLALATAGKRIVAVGERGLIALSDDRGASWRQANSPVSTTLTCVSFADARSGWAAGHAGTILHTADGGATWALQADGLRVAQLVQASVGERGAAADARMSAAAAQLVADGPDKPFLDIQFTDTDHGMAVGAYGLAVETQNGGRTWESFMHRVPNPKGLHLYAVRLSGNAVWLAGEQGYFARSVNGGKDFAAVDTPYRGSYFALAPITGGVVVAGLKGNAFRVSEDGASFRRIEGAPPVSISSVATLRDGRLAFTNQAGQVLLSSNDSSGLTVLPVGPHAPLSGVVQAADGKLILAGATGLDVVGFGLSAPARVKKGGQR